MFDFTKDLYAVRRANGQGSYGNPYDPNSLITGAEVAKGLTYDNSSRFYWDTDSKLVGGFVAPKDVERLYPRVKPSQVPEGWLP